MTRENRDIQPNYSSGEDYILEFRSFRYGFNSLDFRQRVESAAAELDLAPRGTLDEAESVDLVQLVAAGTLEHPVSELGDYIEERGEEVLFHGGECLVYWLRELVFRGAWMDQRLMENQLDVDFDAHRGCFVYFPRGHRTREIGPPPHPSWADVAYRE